MERWEWLSRHARVSLPHRRLQSTLPHRPEVGASQNQRPGKVRQKVVVVRIKHGCIDDRCEDELIWRLQISKLWQDPDAPP